MTRGFCYEESLEYTAPSHGGWGLVRILTQVPELRLLFICPSACGRHSALGAVNQNIKDRVSYYYLDENEIAKGYDAEIKEACKELLEEVLEKPKVLMIIVSCLDDLIGTDVDKVMEELNQEIPSVTFICGHMNPITMDTPSPPLITNLKLIYSLLGERKDGDRGINLIGPFVKPREESELYKFFEMTGCGPLRHITDFNDYEGYQTMAKSMMNLALSPIALPIVKELEEKNRQPFIELFTSYDLEDIDAKYEKLKAHFNLREDIAFLREKRAKALSKIEEVKELCGDREVYIAQGGVFRPFQLGAALKKYGFHVKAIIAQKLLPIEKPYMEELAEDEAIQFLQTQHFNTILFRHRNKDAIGIGLDAAYIAGTDHVLNILNDEELYGYDGLYRLMELIEEAVLQPASLESIIKDYGLVI